MKDYLNGVLKDGEQVLWEGKPEPFKLLEGVYKKSILTLWGILGAVYVLAVVGYLSTAIKRGDPFASIMMLVVVITVFIVFILTVPISDRKTLITSTRYILTDRRAIIINKAGVKSMPVNKETPCKVAHLDNNTDVLYFGDACEIKADKSRKAAVAGITASGSKDITGLAFYGIKDAKEICMNYTFCYMA